MKEIYHALLKRLAHFQVEHPYVSIAFLIALTFFLIVGAGQVKTVASLEQMMPKDTNEIKAFNMLRDNGMGQDSLAVVLEINRDTRTPGVLDIRSYDVYRYLSSLQDELSQELDILSTTSMVDIIGHDLSEEAYTQRLLNPAVQEQLSSWVNADGTVTMLVATTDISANDPRMNRLATSLQEHVETLGHPAGVHVKLTGTPIIQQRLGELISQDRTNTQWISTLFVFIITLLIFGTFTSAFVPLLVVTLSVTWLYGTMGFGNLPISTLAGGVAAMVIGIGIDFAIHIMNKFKYERKKGYSLKHAVEQAVVDTGTALTATSLTTIVAFLAFLSGVMPEMGRFGILMAIGIAYSLLFSLFGLPALLIVEEKLIYMFRKKLKFGVEGEFHLSTEKEVRK